MHAIIEKLRRHTVGQKLPPPVSESGIAEAERRLGFRLPDLLREIYGTVADGGFGPHYGFYPLYLDFNLAGPGTAGCDSVLHFYTVFRSARSEEASPPWPERLLPVLEWGCSAWSCVDCSCPALPVVRHEPDSRTVESPNLEQWLIEWMNGRDMWVVSRR